MSFSPVLGNPKPQYEIASTGIPAVNYTLTFSEAGTSTPLDTYTDSSGATANDNPLTLNARGEPENAIGGATMIYGNTLTPYKVTLKDDAGAVVWTIDDVYPGVRVDEWISATAATRASTTTFTVSGSDVTSTFHVGRRVKCTGGADRYGIITATTFSTNTTVTVSTITDNAGTTSTLHASMDTAYIGVLSANSTSSGITFYPTQSWETGVVFNTFPPLNSDRYGCKGDNGTTDNYTFLLNLWTSANSYQELITDNTQGNQIHGATVEFEGGNYYVSAMTQVPSRTRVNGNNSAIYSDQAITLLDLFGFEIVVSQMRFYKGSIALSLSHGNTDQSIVTIKDCYFDDQTTLSIQAIGTFSTKLHIEDCKWRVTAAALDSECDEVTVSGGWITAFTAGISYFKSTGHLTMKDILMVPSPPDIDATANWIQLGDSGNLIGNLSCSQIRFGGEAPITYLKSYAKANSTAAGIRRTIDIENCELWVSGNIELVEIPNILNIRRNHIAVSAQVTVKTLGAGVIASTSLEKFNIEDDGILWDNSTNTYLLGESSGYGNGKNQINTNAGFTGFTVGSALAGGATALQADVFPTNNIKQVTTGVKTTEPQLFLSHGLATALTGIHTLQVYVKSDLNLKVTLQVGTRNKAFPIEGNDTYQKVHLTGLLTAAAQSVAASFFDMPDSVTAYIGHPILFAGNKVTDVLLQAPNTTTSTIDLINGKYYSSTVPSDGFWYKGTIIYKLALGVDGSQMVLNHWACTASGTPGTWVAQYLSTVTPAT